VSRGQPPDGGRTAEEREAARLEREARRAAREGNGSSEDGQAPPAATPAAARRTAQPGKPKAAKPKAAKPKAATPQAATPKAAKPRAAKPKAAAKPAAATDGNAKPTAKAKPKAKAKPRAAAAAKPAARKPEPRPAAPVAEAAPEHQVAPTPPPIAPRQLPPEDDWLEEARRLTGPDGGPATPATQRPVGRMRAGYIVFALALLGVLAFAGWFAISLFQPFKDDSAGEGTQQRVVVPKGAGVGEIGDMLAERGIVSSSFFFQWRARLDGRTGNLKPGSYRLRRDMSFTAALDTLEKGTPPNIIVLTIPEGRSRREVAGLVKGKLEGDYMKATRRSPALDPREYGAKNVPDLEGFLFPATFELRRGRPMSALVEQQLSTFRNQFENVDLRYARTKNLTAYDVLTIASLVEREAQLPKERAVIASVIYNRLKQGMPLGIDATVRFVTRNWERPLRESELANPSPYNTRIHSGLPPGPIGSPGIDSIRAAARPARTGYLFYVVKPGGNGAHSFSETDAEFQRDVARYNRERERRGGQSPASP